MKFLRFGIIMLFMMALTAVSIAQTPVPQQAPQSTTTVIEIGDEELEDFAEAIKKLTVMQQEAQTEMVAIITDKGMDMNTFNMIQRAQAQDQELDDIDEETMESFEEVQETLMEMQQELNEEMQEIIQDSGIEAIRFQQISTAIQRDAELQERYRKVAEGLEEEELD